MTAMRPLCGLTVGLMALAAGGIAPAQNLGTPPVPGLGAIDIFTALKLPAFQDAPDSPLEVTVSKLQVGNRARTLGLSSASAIDSWNAAQTLLTSPTRSVRRPPSIHPASLVVFNGATASALNQILARPDVTEVQVRSATLAIDQPVEVQRSGLVLDLGTTQVVGANPQPYMVRIENATDIVLLHGNFISGDSAILVNASNGVVIDGAEITGLSGAGIVVTGSGHVTLSGNQIQGLGLAGITIHRGTYGSVVEHNKVTANVGYSNLMAGIVVTDNEVDLSSNPRAIFRPDGYGVFGQPISQRIHPPHDNVIAWNHVTLNHSSGVYMDGAIRTVVFSNSIESNSKEGLCLDDGATANVVASNTFLANGKRWGDPDSVLALDFILGGGRLADGTAAEKVPGISLDNAIYNVVFANNLAHNFGGGVKIVRTGYFNAIGANILLDDNDGASTAYHFFGIELGAASSDGPDVVLDFTPSRGNIVFSNLIRGNHYSGIYFDFGSNDNNVLDNTILDATAWALESAEQMTNTSTNNLTTLPSRNIGSGLDPALIATGQPVDDPPPL